jgi:hypothetical protein
VSACCWIVSCRCTGIQMYELMRVVGSHSASPSFHSTCVSANRRQRRQTPFAKCGSITVYKMLTDKIVSDLVQCPLGTSSTRKCHCPVHCGAQLQLSTHHLTSHHLTSDA